MTYKEEIAVALFEASQRKMAEKFEHDSLLKLKRASVNVCLETAEICTKVLDWHSNSTIQQEQTMLGEFVTSKFLLFVEEIAATIYCKKVEYAGECVRLQNLLIEVYKRISNLTERSQSDQECVNLDCPLSKSQAIFLLAKYLEEPTAATGTTKTSCLAQLVLLTKKQLNAIISMPKDKCLQNSKVVCYLLNALYQIYKASDDKNGRPTSLRHDVNNILLLVNMGFEKIAKQCIVEVDVRTLQSVLDLVRTILRKNEQQQADQVYGSTPSNVWLVECESRMLLNKSLSQCITSDSPPLLLH